MLLRSEFLVIVIIFFWAAIALVFQLTNLPLEIATIRNNHPFQPNPLFDFWAFFTNAISGGENFLDTDAYYFHIRRLLDLLGSQGYSIYTILGYTSGGEIETPKFLGFFFSRILIDFFSYSEMTAALTATVLFTSVISVISIILNIYTFNRLGIFSPYRIYFILMMVPALYGYQFEAYQLSLLGYNFILSGLIFRTFEAKDQPVFVTIFTFLGVYLVCLSGDFHNILYLPIVFLVEICFLLLSNRLTSRKVIFLLLAYSTNLLFFISTFQTYYFVMSTAAQNFSETAVMAEKGLNLIPTTVVLETPILRKIFNTISQTDWVFKSPTIKLNFLAISVLILAWREINYRYKSFLVGTFVLFVGYLHLILNLFSDVFASETSVKLYVLLNLPLLYIAFYFFQRAKIFERSRLVEIIIIYLWIEVILLQTLTLFNTQSFLHANHFSVVLILTVFYFSILFKKETLIKYTMVIFVISSALGVQSVGNYRLREISSHTDFYDKFISKIVPKGSVISIMPVKSSENFQPNIFMGTNLFSTDGYLSPTPENYSSFMSRLADVGQDNFRYNDLPRMPFYGVENQNKYDEKFKFFKTDYILTKSKIDQHTYVGSYNNYHLYFRENLSSSIKKINIEVDCGKEICDTKSIKYDIRNDKLILNLRFDPSLELIINGKLSDTEQCQQYFLCVDYPPDLVQTAKFKINSN